MKVKSNEGSLLIYDGDDLLGSIPFGTQRVALYSDGVRLSVISSSVTYDLPYSTEVDDESFANKEELAEKLASFKRGGGNGSSGVASVTGQGVGGTSENPVIRFPTPTEIGAVQEIDTSNSSEPNKVVKYSNTGSVNTSDPVLPENSVNLNYLNNSLNSKVDKVAGKDLSDRNFTEEEKQKLAGLEDVHYKGWFPSLTDLETRYPTSDEGSHAFVDDPSGSILYIWNVGTETWDARVGESTEMTASQVKVLYESNPDTNAFTNDLKSKLESMTSVFTSALKNTYDNAVAWINANKDDLATKDYVDNLANKVWMPDYINMETTNRITSSGGTWTSDRVGFVYVFSRGYNSGIYNTEVVSINGKEVGKIWVEANSGSGNARSGSFANIYPVKEGDTILVRGNLETKCLFIPGVWV